MSCHPPMTLEEKEMIKSLRDNYRLTGYEIARKIGRSKSAVYRHLRANAEPNWTDREVSILTECYQKKISVKKIAQRLKRRSPRAVMVKMCRHRKKVRNNPDIKRAAYLLEVAFAAGLSPGRAIQKIRTHDIYAKLKLEEEAL
jgi:DNA-binding transcriptional ArsR family regulator